MKHLKRYTQLFENQQELSQEQRDWLDKCTNRSWKVNPETGLVDVRGDFRCDRQGLDSFKGVRFGRISGKFDCSENRLTSLEGAPQRVGNYFDCSNNSLTSLEGAPQSVGMHFDCSYNSLISLEGAPQRVGGDFYCFVNRLTSLEGAPQSVGGGFYCHSNSLTSLEGAPQSVGGTFSCYNNSLTSLEGAPQSVGGGFYCYANSLTSLEGAPQRVGGDFYCHTNTISERTIKEVLKRMSDSGISLGQAVESYWKSIPKDDRLYLAKHHPSLPGEDKRGYAALLKFRGKII